MFTAQPNAIDQLSWGSPVGVAILLVGLALSFYFFSLAIKNLDALESKKNQ